MVGRALEVVGGPFKFLTSILYILGMAQYLNLGHGYFKFGNVIGQNEGEYFQ